MKDLKQKLYRLLEDWVACLSLSEINNNQALIKAIEAIELELRAEGK